MDIEVLATAEIKTSISLTDALTTFIAEKDKEPIWDGNIHVYSDSKKDLIHHKGRVPVQVKGKLTDNINQDKFTYPVRTTDLKSYLAEGGTIYFVVLIDKVMGGRKIFYARLLPFELIKLLGQAQGQDTKNVTMIPFPTINTDKVDIFLNFIRDRKDQQPTASSEKIYTLEEIAEKGALKELNFGYTSSKKSEDPFDYLFNNGMYIYAVTTLGTKYAIQHVTQVEVATAEYPTSVTINGKQYFDKYKWDHWKDKDVFHFGKNVVMKLDNEKGESKFNISFNGGLREQIAGLEFYIAAIEAQHYYVGQAKIPLTTDDPKEIENLELPVKKEHLAMLKKVQKALDIIGVKDDLDCDNLSEKDENNLRFLTRGYVDKKEVTFETDAEVFVSGYLTIANLRMMITAHKQKSEAYLLGNFFEDELSLQRKDEKGNFYNVSQCYVLSRNDYHEVANINYDFIFNDIIKYPLITEYENDINLMLLEMLSAYDEKENCDLLELAIRVSKWLWDNTSDSAVSRMNYYQAKYRKTDLEQCEIEWLQDHFKIKDTPKDQKLGCAILLKKYELCDYLYADFTKEEQDNFSLFPIMNLWKNREII